MIPKRPPYRSPAFLRFAHDQGGGCCLARVSILTHGGPVELHHYGDKGMGQKASDLLVARVCQRCHAAVQGKRSAMSFERAGMGEIYWMVLEDNLKLLAAYAEHLEGRKHG